MCIFIFLSLFRLIKLTSDWWVSSFNYFYLNSYCVIIIPFSQKLDTKKKCNINDCDMAMIKKYIFVSLIKIQ